MTYIKNISSTTKSTRNINTKFTLRENIAALTEFKNENIIKQKQKNTDITSALVNLKWMNRRDLYPWLIKEEIYHLVLSAIVQTHPECEDQVMSSLKSTIARE